LHGDLLAAGTLGPGQDHAAKRAGDIRSRVVSQGGVQVELRCEAYCEHVVLSSEHDWNPQNVCFPEATRTVEEEISRTIGSVQTSVDQTDIDDYATDREAVLYDIGEMSQRMIASVKVREVPRQVSQVEVQDVPQVKTFQSKGRH